MKKFHAAAFAFCIFILVSQNSHAGLNALKPARQFFLAGLESAPAAVAQDSDNDSIDDSIDNCPGVYNPGQTDNDSDGYGNVCDNSTAFAVLDTQQEAVVIFDNATGTSTTVDINGLASFWTMRNAGDSGWLLKGYDDSKTTATIWHMDTSGTLRGSIPGMPGGIFYAGLNNGTVVQNDYYTGDLTLTSSDGVLLKTINVRDDVDNQTADNGTFDNITWHHMGDIAGLSSGGFVVVPESGRINAAGAGYTPLLCYYSDNLTLQSAVDISALQCTLISLAGMPGGTGFAALGNRDGGQYIKHLFYFDDAGQLIQERDITVDVPSYEYRNFLISAGSNGDVTVSLWSGTSVWVYHVLQAANQAAAVSSLRSMSSTGGIGEPALYDLSGIGIRSIGAIGGSYRGTGTPEASNTVRIFPGILGWLIGEKETTRLLLAVGSRGTEFDAGTAVAWNTQGITTLTQHVLFKRFMFMKVRIDGSQVSRQDYEVSIGNCKGTIHMMR